ncbi:MAG: flippase-like domain-containing protein [Candidatus Levybacteria bacterium]|nr:flippase-like domain-containing protein [Candidatus Levybacteria bacterium]
MKGKALLTRLLISAVIVYFFLKKIELRDIVTALTSAQHGYLILAFMVALLAWFVAAIKWQLLVPNKALSIQRAFQLTLITLSYSFLLPGGQFTGEVGKFLHTQNTQSTISRSSVFISIVYDKMLGIWAIICIGFAGSLLDRAHSFKMQYLYAVLLAIVTVALIIMINTKALSKLINLLNQLRLRPALKLFFSRLPILKQTLQNQSGKISYSLLLSLLYQLLIILVFWILAQSLDVKLSFISLMWIGSAVGFLTALPITYAGLGIREMSFVYLFSLYGIGAGRAVAFSLLIYVVISVGSLSGLALILRDYATKKQPLA